MIKNKISFNNKIYMIGFGSVGHVLLNLIIKVIDVDPKKIYIIDSRDISNEVEYFTKMAISYSLC